MGHRPAASLDFYQARAAVKPPRYRPVGYLDELVNSVPPEQPQITTLPSLYWLRGAVFTPYVALRVLPHRLNRNVFPPSSWSVEVVFGKLQERSNVFRLADTVSV